MKLFLNVNEYRNQPKAEIKKQLEKQRRGIIWAGAALIFLVVFFIYHQQYEMVLKTFVFAVPFVLLIAFNFYKMRKHGFNTKDTKGG